MISGQKLLLVSALVSTAMAAVDPRIQCTEENKCGTDVSCIAKCYGVPHPSESDIRNTNDCFDQCKTSQSIPEIEKCRQTCVNEYFQPTSSVANKPTATVKSTTSVKPTEASTSKPESDSKSSSSASRTSSSSSSSNSSSSSSNTSSASSSHSSSTSSSSVAHSTDKSDHKNSAISQTPILSVVSFAAVFAAVSAFL